MWCSGNITESAALDKHRSERCMPARVLRGLAGPGRVERGGQGAVGAGWWGGLGRQFLWENSCYHTVIPYQGLVPGHASSWTRHTQRVNEAHVCVSLVRSCALSVCMCGCV